MSYLSTAYRIAVRVERHPSALAQRAAQANESLCRRRAARQARLLRGHLGARPVLILGSGPALGAVDQATWEALRRRFFIIGVNRTFYRCALDLFLSAYPSEHALALLHRRRIGSRIQMRPTSYIPVIRGATGWLRVPLGTVEVAPSLGTGGPPVVRTKLNVALGATDLAVRLGAKEVYFLAVEQNNQAHYYDHDPALKQQLRDDLGHFAGLDTAFTADHPYATVSAAMKRLDQPVDVLERTPFYEVEHTDTFSALFDEFSASGVRFASVGADTVVARAGAPVVSLADLTG